MSRPPSQIDPQLQASLRRFSGALEHNRSQHASIVEAIMSATTAEVAEHMQARTEEISARIAARHQRRMERWERRAERRRRRAEHDAAGDLPRGIVFAIAAIVCLLFALEDPPLFWMVFVAIGMGISAASSFGRYASRRRLEREVEAEGRAENAGATLDAAQPARAATAEQRTAPPAPPGARAAERPAPKVAPVPAPDEPADPKVARIQSLCDKLLAELESGPPIVREVVTEPQATIGGLRQACLETARRERELRTVLAAQDEAKLVAERDALAARLSNEHDEIVRDRLGQALGALEQQLANRAELATAATRLEAENMRILYTLENLHMQLLRARSTDIGAPELGGKLRDGLRALGTQIDAVAEALEFASAPGSGGGATRAPASATPEAAPASTDAERAVRERAEREAAARRAAQAREALRQR